MNLATLPAPLSANWDWQIDAACRGMNVDLFFQADSARGSTKKAHEKRAMAVCATCPVQLSCLEWALTVNERDGVWGGTTPEQRKKLARRHAA